MDMPAHILILAGRRGGTDPVAEFAGVSHKALVPVGGVAMLERVASTVRAGCPRATIAVAIDLSPDIDALLAHIGGLEILAPGPSPAATVEDALNRFGAPLLVVTADHPLLTVAMIQHFVDGIDPYAAGAAAVATRATIEAQYQSRRTYWRFAGQSVSGCNLFYLGEKADAAVAFWRTLEADRKRPLKVLHRLGIWTALRFICGILSLSDALRRLERLTGTRLCVVTMPFAEAAIDVDHIEDLVLVERILNARMT